MRNSVPPRIPFSNIRKITTIENRVSSNSPSAVTGIENDLLQPDTQAILFPKVDQLLWCYRDNPVSIEFGQRRHPRPVRWGKELWLQYFVPTRLLSADGRSAMPGGPGYRVRLL